ncbi:L-threonylcarbamoyladenylate synthase [Candidatus Omnitrophota bacterium]
MFTAAKTRLIRVNGKDPDPEAISICAEVLRQGGLVAFPTETVYGLGADAFNKEAVEKIYEVKDRPRSKPLTLHISDIKMIEDAGCVITPQAKKLIDAFWPGPITIILSSRNGAKIGFRMPRNEVALRLINGLKRPVVAPSANTSGEKPPTDAIAVVEAFNGRIDIVLDAGSTELRRESSVVDATAEPPEVLRKGALDESEILKAVS